MKSYPRLITAVSACIAFRLLPHPIAFEPLQVALFFLFLYFIGWIFQPLLQFFLEDPFSSQILSRPIGLLIWTWSTWWAPAVGLFDRNRWVLEATLILFSFLSDRMKKPLPHGLRKEILFHEWGWFGVAAVFYIFKIYTPEIFWGEKPLDFTLLNYFIRETHYPPEDPWAAGWSLQYYYFGSLFCATPLQFLKVSASVGYLAWLSALPAFLFSSVTFLLRRSFFIKNLHFISALVFVFGAGLPALLEWAKGEPLAFSLFWKATRAFQDPAFAEFPLWAYLFGDLHAHVIFFPLLPVAIHFLLNAPSSQKEIFIRAFVWGSVFAMNTWDAIALAVLAPIFLLGRRASIIKEILPSSVLSFFFFGPILISIFARHSAGLSFSFHTGPWNHPFQILSFFFVGFAGILLGGFARFKKGAQEKSPKEVLVLMGALALLLFSELVVVIDRMNTIFKFYQSIGVLLFVGGVLGFNRFIRSYPKALIPVSLVILLPSLFSSLLVLGSFLPDQKVGGPRPSINGARYLDFNSPDEAELFRWMNENIQGTPTIAEAAGPIYGPYSRVAMHTGLPTYLGWDWHVFQRAVPNQEIEKRKNILALIYGEKDPFAKREWLKHEKIEWIVVSGLEREQYGERGVESLLALAKRDAAFQVAFHRNSTTLLHIDQNAL